MILDIAVVVISLIAIVTGYNKGALATLLSILGYFGGGVLGFALANWYASDFHSVGLLVLSHLFGIFVGAILGRFILQKSGIGIHKRILFGPLRLLNSFLGAALSLTQLAIVVLVIIILIYYLPWELPNSIIEGSRTGRTIVDFNPFDKLLNRSRFTE